MIELIDENDAEFTFTAKNITHHTDLCITVRVRIIETPPTFTLLVRKEKLNKSVIKMKFTDTSHTQDEVCEEWSFVEEVLQWIKERNHGFHYYVVENFITSKKTANDSYWTRLGREIIEGTGFEIKLQGVEEVK